MADDGRQLESDLRIALLTGAAGWRDRNSDYGAAEMAVMAVLTGWLLGIAPSGREWWWRLERSSIHLGILAVSGLVLVARPGSSGRSRPRAAHVPGDRRGDRSQVEAGSWRKVRGAAGIFM